MENLKHLRLGSKAPGHLLSVFPVCLWLGAVSQSSESVLPRGDRNTVRKHPNAVNNGQLRALPLLQLLMVS